MKFSLTILLLVLGSIIWNTAVAEELPKTDALALQQREQNLGHQTYDWNCTEDVSVPARDTHHVSEVQITEQARQMAKQTHITEQQAVEEVRRDLAALAGGYSIRSHSTQRFEANGDMMKISRVDPATASSQQTVEYYGNGFGLMVKDSIHLPNMKDVTHPAVWGCEGNGVRWRSPFQDGLNLSPEDFAILTGKNPVAMYGGQWKLVKATPTSWLLEMQVNKGNFAPFSARMTLDREHGGAPSQISIKGSDWSSEYNVSHYTKHEGNWICTEVSYSEDHPEVLSRKRTFVLTNVVKSEPIVMSLPSHVYVNDYRLLGQNLTTGDVLLNLKKPQSDKITSYLWSGQLPHLTELEQIYQKQHPGEATPDPKANASLPFVGGLLCLVGGVWMFKRRGVS